MDEDKLQLITILSSKPKGLEALESLNPETYNECSSSKQPHTHHLQFQPVYARNGGI